MAPPSLFCHLRAYRLSDVSRPTFPTEDEAAYASHIHAPAELYKCAYTHTDMSYVLCSLSVDHLCINTAPTRPSEQVHAAEAPSIFLGVNMLIFIILPKCYDSCLHRVLKSHRTAKIDSNHDIQSFILQLQRSSSLPQTSFPILTPPRPTWDSSGGIRRGVRSHCARALAVAAERASSAESASSPMHKP